MSGRNVVRQSSRPGGSGGPFDAFGPAPLISVSFPFLVYAAISSCLREATAGPLIRPGRACRSGSNQARSAVGESLVWSYQMVIIRQRCPAWPDRTVDGGGCHAIPGGISSDLSNIAMATRCHAIAQYN